MTCGFLFGNFRRPQPTFSLQIFHCSKFFYAGNELQENKIIRVMVNLDGLPSKIPVCF